MSDWVELFAILFGPLTTLVLIGWFSGDTSRRLFGVTAQEERLREVGLTTGDWSLGQPIVGRLRARLPVHTRELDAGGRRAITAITAASSSPRRYTGDAAFDQAVPVYSDQVEGALVLTKAAREAVRSFTRRGGHLEAEGLSLTGVRHLDEATLQQLASGMVVLRDMLTQGPQLEALVADPVEGVRWHVAELAVAHRGRPLGDRIVAAMSAHHGVDLTYARGVQQALGTLAPEALLVGLDALARMGTAQAMHALAHTEVPPSLVEARQATVAAMTARLGVAPQGQLSLAGGVGAVDVARAGTLSEATRKTETP